MKYVFIDKYQVEFSIKSMCRVLRLARNGWYAWQKQRTVMSVRQQFRSRFDSAVRDAFLQAKQRYGEPRLTDELQAQGLSFNVKAVAANLHRQGLRAKTARKFSLVSCLPVSENLLKQNFSTNGPNRKCTGDITYLRTDEGWLYLAVIIGQ
ncbi:Uncharacterised protein [Serratia marcescens]|nr:Uncharacterised protein [Serratia marcescens]